MTNSQIPKANSGVIFDPLINYCYINSLRNSVIQSEEIIFILRKWQCESLSEHNDFLIMTRVCDVKSAECVFS